MPRGRPKKGIVVVDEPVEKAIPTPTISATSEKAELLVLYKKLKDLGIYSLSNLENRIARAE